MESLSSKFNPHYRGSEYIHLVLQGELTLDEAFEGLKKDKCLDEENIAGIVFFLTSDPGTCIDLDPMSLLVKVIKKYLSLIEELKLKTSIDSLRLLINRLTKLDSFDEKLSEKLSLIYIERIINLADGDIGSVMGLFSHNHDLIKFLEKQKSLNSKQCTALARLIETPTSEERRIQGIIELLNNKIPNLKSNMQLEVELRDNTIKILSGDDAIDEYLSSIKSDPILFSVYLKRCANYQEVSSGNFYL